MAGIHHSWPGEKKHVSVRQAWLQAQRCRASSAPPNTGAYKRSRKQRVKDSPLFWVVRLADETWHLRKLFFLSLSLFLWTLRCHVACTQRGQSVLFFSCVATCVCYSRAVCCFSVSRSLFFLHSSQPTRVFGVRDQIKQQTSLISIGLFSTVYLKATTQNQFINAIVYNWLVTLRELCRGLIYLDSHSGLFLCVFSSPAASALGKREGSTTPTLQLHR